MALKFLDVEGLQTLITNIKTALGQKQSKLTSASPLSVAVGGTGKSSISQGKVLVGGVNNTYNEVTVDTTGANTIVKRDSSGNISGPFSGEITGNAATATKLATARSINGTNFDGSANITTTKWGTSREVTISSSDGTGKGSSVNVDGSGKVELKLPSTIKASITGNVTGNLTGNVTGNITGDVTGNVTGNAGTATTATKLGSSTVGSASQPIYLSSGTATAGSTYAGGTAVTLNGTSKAASTASFYAPTGGGTAGQYLRSNGTGAPTWRASVYIRTSGYPDNPVVGDICIHY